MGKRRDGLEKRPGKKKGGNSKMQEFMLRPEGGKYCHKPEGRKRRGRWCSYRRKNSLFVENRPLDGIDSGHEEKRR